MRKATCLSLAALFCLLTLPAHAQEKKPSPTPKPAAEVDDVIRISTELVQTDVMVFDKDGKFVNDLKQDQFELLIDGQKQPIEFFDSGTTKLSNAMEWVEVPKLKPGAFSISSLYVGEIAAAGGGGQVTVNANRRFARSSRMRFTTYIYNAAHGAAPPQLGVQLKILRGEQAVITPPETKVSTEKLTNFTNITYTGEFPLSSLPPGSYTMQVIVTDKLKTTSASQQLKFTVY